MGKQVIAGTEQTPGIAGEAGGEISLLYHGSHDPISPKSKGPSGRQDPHLGEVEAPSRGRCWRCSSAPVVIFFNKLNSQLDLAEKSIAGLEKAVKIHGAKLATPQSAAWLLGWCDVWQHRKGGKI